ncbi:HAMP domain-containing histidine kinase [Achromobacter sp. GG226]|uniref:ATP-binding protein n=1 Tax=Verticiella alkaliphila TaxID=2779529 RepID=UPI001C0CF141|nr:ATP-binding protein [Verticiella sp. GG226]MBU4612494.1 HAMP domain-containing histidine kinase [Verticiella sp. GG226]
MTARTDPLPAAASARQAPPAATDTTGRKNMQQLIQLRWLAALGQVMAITVAAGVFDVPLPLTVMLGVLGGLVAFNLVSLLWLKRRREVSNTELLISLLVDVGALTAQLYLSGGTSNPFIFLYLLQVTLAAILLQPWSTWLLVAVTGICFIGLAVVGQPLSLPLDHDLGLHSLYIQGLLLCFALNAALLVVFISRISRNLRARDSRLAHLRQRAAEEEHIVRMGLLASGAAHELGTPLATVAVILGDWRRMPAFAHDPDLQQEIDEMQAQVQRCKSILRGILMSAGETLGQAPAPTTVRTFLADVVTEWRTTRGANSLIYADRFGQDVRIVSDTALKQMIHNVLDNALEASPHRIQLDLERDADALRLTVTDEGPGFVPSMLTQLGKPYQSSKASPGSGLGLFLVVNVARTLGGSVSAHNRPEGGAIVTLSLPLPALMLEEPHHEPSA